jgi:serine/threonine protein kinase
MDEDLLPVRPGTIVTNTTKGHAYRIGKRLGVGGFGAAYRARQVRGTPRLAGTVCLKVSAEPDAWHREAYFGQLLDGVRGTVAIHDSFAAFPPEGAGTAAPLYCLVSELAENGDLGHYLESGPKPWSEAKVCREVRNLLQTLVVVHDSGAVHRDLTPTNVFVTAAETLKLADFGIARHRHGKREVLADAWNPWFAPTRIAEFDQRSWRTSDDVYQVGMLLGALLCGYAREKLLPDEVRTLPCSPWLKAIVQRAIGERRKRFKDAAAMLEALNRRQQNPHRPTRVSSLKAKVVVFTGGLSISRGVAAALAKAAGATVKPKIGVDTDVVVLGAAAPDWKAEAKGQKLLDVDREAERGHAIAVLDERRFLTLAGRQPDARRPRVRIPMART